MSCTAVYILYRDIYSYCTILLDIRVMDFVDDQSGVKTPSVSLVTSFNCKSYPPPSELLWWVCLLSPSYYTQLELVWALCANHLCCNFTAYTINMLSRAVLVRFITFLVPIPPILVVAYCSLFMTYSMLMHFTLYQIDQLVICIYVLLAYMHLGNFHCCSDFCRS